MTKSDAKAITIVLPMWRLVVVSMLFWLTKHPLALGISLGLFGEDAVERVAELGARFVVAGMRVKA